MDKTKEFQTSKLIRDAGFRYSNACMEDIEYHADRKLDKSQRMTFSTCNYIFRNHHIILMGAAGSGKTYLACALGIAACRNYVNLSTQFEPGGWYTRRGDEADATICEFIFDRIIHNAYHVLIEGCVSMRERRGLKVSQEGASND